MIKCIQNFLRGKSSQILPILLLFAGVFAVYSATFGHEFLINWDDEGYVLKNEAAKGFSSSHIKAAFSSYFVGNYAPVQILSYMLDYELWGMKAAGFIGTNLLLHALNGIMLYHLVEKLCRDRLIAFSAAFIFLFHPVQVESVAWISQRKNLLAMFFFLVAFLLYRRYREECGMGVYICSVAVFTLALLSKAVVVIFPMVALLFDVCFTGKNARSWLKDKIPYLAASMAVGCLALISHSPVLNRASGIRDYPGGSLLTTFYTMMPVLSEYLRDCFLPFNLSPYYMTPIKIFPDRTVLLSSMLLLLLVMLGTVLFRKNRMLFFWYTLFFVGLLPVSQVVPIITLKNDRYLYFPMLGFAPFIAISFITSIRKFAKWRPIAWAFALVAMCSLPVLSYQQSLVWKDSFTLWSYALQKDPNNQVALQMLALYHTRHENWPAAIDAVDRLNRLRKEHGPVRGWK
jgi:protein O-mannosyl-transferase